MYRNNEKNIRQFTAICNNDFGRKIIYTNAEEVNQENIIEELNKALPIHQQNKKEIMYLDRYYRGDQPILYYKKVVRPEINNRIVENHAFELVESKTAELVGEPVQYVLRGSDPKKSEMVKRLNDFMESEDKGYYDIELCRWRSICGTSYRFIPNDMGKGTLMDETPFAIRIEHPAETFIVYFSDSKKAAFSCQIRKDVNNEQFYFIYTNNQYFKIQNDKIQKSGVNGNFMIPVIEYPNNERRLSDIEVTILLTDLMNSMVSNRANGIEQFIQALMKFKNCEIDEKSFMEMVNLGAIAIKGTSNNGDCDVEMMASELNQDQNQIAKDDVYQNFLLIQGKPGRQENSGGDTGQAVVLRNGYYESEKRAELSEPIFKKSERDFLRVVLNRLRIFGEMDLKISDIEIKITRSKTDNMAVKANVLQILLNCGIEFGRAIKTVGLWSDPEEVTIESRERMNSIYPITQENSDISKEINENNMETIEN